MYNIFPLILILLGLGSVAIIFFRKFPFLANLDVENMPKEKEARFKEQIINDRLRRNLTKWSSRFLNLIKSGNRKFSPVFSKFYKKLIEVKENYAEENDLEDEGKKIEDLFVKFDEAEDTSEKEKILIKIISIDPKNIKAFRKLGDFYLADKKHEEARQSLLHALKIGEKDLDDDYLAEIHFDLALIEKSDNREDACLGQMEKVLALSPNNPRYLNVAIESAIEAKNKEKALQAYKKLKSVNPENNKLPEIKERIEKI